MPNHVNGLLSPLLRRMRIDAVRPYLRSGRILDFGCGIGILSTLVEPERYVGIDHDPDCIAEARRLHPSHRFELVEEFRPDGPYDRFVALAVIEHVDQPWRFVEWARSLLAPSGLIVLTTPRPSFQKLHDLGGRLRLFSNEGPHAHPSLMDHQGLRELASRTEMGLLLYRRFLLGANQLAILSPGPARAASRAARPGSAQTVTS